MSNGGAGARASFAGVRSAGGRIGPGNRWGRSIVVGWLGLLVLTVQPATAGLIQKTVDPNPMTIKCDGETLGKLEITNYYGWMSDKDAKYDPRNPYTDSGYYTDPKAPNRDGAIMQAVFTVDPKACQSNYQWVQAITSGKGTNGTPPYLDPFGRDDDLPFYWTTKEAKTDKQGKLNGIPGSQFIDIPSETNANKGNEIHFEAALVQYCGMQIHWLAGFTWGYTIDNNSKIVLDPFAWTAGMSNVMTNLITNWASTPTAPYLPKPGQKPDGWKVTDKCLCCPEPDSIVLSVIGLCGLGLGHAARRRVVPSERPAPAA